MLLTVLFLALNGSAQNYSVKTIPNDLIENNQAVIRLEEIQVHLTAVDELTVKRKEVVTILEQSGDFLAQIQMGYDDFTKIKSYSASVYDASGKKIKNYHKKKDFMDVSYLDGITMYSDNRKIVSTFMPTTYPFKVEYEYEYKTKNTLFIPNWFPVYGDKVAVEKSIYTLYNSSGIKIITQENAFTGNAITKDITPQKISYSLENYKGFNQEPFLPSIYEILPNVRISPLQFSLMGFKGSYSNWKEFGEWMYTELLKKNQTLPEGEIQKIKNLVKDIPTETEKVKAVYQYLQDKTRYIFVSIGIGGWQPFPAKHVSKNSYGDCKGLSNYMISLLKSIDIDANYTVLYHNREQNQNINPDFPSLQGNHVIVNVPVNNDTLWLECTSQQIAFNHIGSGQ